jgi:hypothetical protein
MATADPDRSRRKGGSVSEIVDVVDVFAEERNDPSPRPEWWRAWCGPLAYSHLGRDELFPSSCVMLAAQSVSGGSGAGQRGDEDARQ